MPIQADRWRPFSNSCESTTRALSALAMTGPMEGTVSRRGPSSLALFSLRSAASSLAISALVLSICCTTTSSVPRPTRGHFTAPSSSGTESRVRHPTTRKFPECTRSRTLTEHQRPPLSRSIRLLPTLVPAMVGMSVAMSGAGGSTGVARPCRALALMTQSCRTAQLDDDFRSPSRSGRIRQCSQTCAVLGSRQQPK